MKALPFSESMRFNSQLSDDEIVDRIHVQLEPKQKHRQQHWLINSYPTKTFEGTVFNYHIKMNRIYDKWFTIRRDITGRIKQNAFTTTVDIKIQFSTKENVFLILVFFILSMVCVRSMITLLSGNDITFYTFLPFILLAILFSPAFFAYKRGVKNDIADLSEIFNSDPESI